ncbi:hypothetical protein Peur_030419 [Populus x canadensis]
MAFRTRKPSNQVAPPPERQQNSSPTPLQNPNYHPDDFFTLCNILKDPKIQPDRPYKSYRTGPELSRNWVLYGQYLTILIRMSVAAIRTFKYASSSDLICNSDAGMSLFDIVGFPL